MAGGRLEGSRIDERATRNDGRHSHLPRRCHQGSIAEVLVARGVGCAPENERVQLLFFFLGTLAPFFRAFDRPMAMACLRLLAFPPLPLFCVPFLVFFTAFLTSLWAFLPYFAMTRSSRRD